MTYGDIFPLTTFKVFLELPPKELASTCNALPYFAAIIQKGIYGSRTVMEDRNFKCELLNYVLI